MQIVFTKGKEKADTLTLKRDDGSVSLTPLNRGMIEHDLLHYVVESVLQFKEGFYGMLSRGYTIDDFTTPFSERPEALRSDKLPSEVLQVEYIVGLLQMELVENKAFNNFIEILTEICEGRKTDFPEMLNQQTLNTIRDEANAIINKWRGLAFEEQIEVTINLS